MSAQTHTDTHINIADISNFKKPVARQPKLYPAQPFYQPQEFISRTQYHHELTFLHNQTTPTLISTSIHSFLEL